MRLPDRATVHKTSADDPVDYYYHPIYGLVYRRRLAMALELLGRSTFDRLLEIGYGSGILLPELARRTRSLHAIDQHTETGSVAAMLEAAGVTATLRVGDILALPYERGEFDAVVCLSVLEHLTDLDGACRQIASVLKPDGVAVVGFPVANGLTSALFRWLGYRAKDIHPSGHAQILSALRRRFALARTLTLPAHFPIPLSLYVACECRVA